MGRSGTVHRQCVSGIVESRSRDRRNSLMKRLLSVSRLNAVVSGIRWVPPLSGRRLLHLLPQRPRVKPCSINTASPAITSTTRSPALHSTRWICRASRKDGDVWEKAIKKLKGGMMPPPGAKQPDRAAVLGIRLLAGNFSGCRGRGGAESGKHRTASTQSRRVCRIDQGTFRHRCGLRCTASTGRYQQWL